MKLAWLACQFERARRDFHRHREWLEVRFLEVAGRVSAPRGLRWRSCEFEDEVVYARERRSGGLRAFVGMTVYFEAVEGGPMEGVEAVARPRAATAVFCHRRGVWETDGRAIFNLNPVQAIAHFQHELEEVPLRG
ncbi:MAG: hypothetical protein K6T86_19270 [Pirellulales bacterium]|jgi:hypothetical protein|nr:hypothetical protein [Pirellulales bacterium]